MGLHWRILRCFQTELKRDIPSPHGLNRLLLLSLNNISFYLKTELNQQTFQHHHGWQIAKVAMV